MFVTCAMLQSIAVDWPEDKHDQLPGRLCCAVCSFGSTGNFAGLQQSFCFLHLGLQNIVGCGLGLGAWKLLLLERSICGWSGQQRPVHIQAYVPTLAVVPLLYPAWSPGGSQSTEVTWTTAQPSSDTSARAFQTSR